MNSNIIIIFIDEFHDLKYSLELVIFCYVYLFLMKTGKNLWWKKELLLVRAQKILKRYTTRASNDTVLKTVLLFRYCLTFHLCQKRGWGRLFRTEPGSFPFSRCHFSPTFSLNRIWSDSIKTRAGSNLPYQIRRFRWKKWMGVAARWLANSAQRIALWQNLIFPASGFKKFIFFPHKNRTWFIMITIAKPYFRLKRNV